MTTLRIMLLAALMAPVAGCSAVQHRAAVRDDGTGRLTVGAVQQKIRIGMSVADVAAALGAPNIVSTDEKRREVWIYDKIATERVFSTSDSSLSLSAFGAGPVGSGAIAGAFVPGLISGLVWPYYGQSSGATSTSQSTLTVVIKFDEEMKVRDLAYHESRF